MTDTLLIVCNGKAPKVFESSTKISNLDPLPSKDFDIIVWTDCDLKSELRKVKLAFPQLNIGGKIYIMNLLKDFPLLLEDCNQKLVEKIYNNKITSNYIKTADYIIKTQQIISNLFDANVTFEIIDTEPVLVISKDKYFS